MSCPVIKLHISWTIGTNLHPAHLFILKIKRMSTHPSPVHVLTPSVVVVFLAQIIFPFSPFNFTFITHFEIVAVNLTHIFTYSDL